LLPLRQDENLENQKYASHKTPVYKSQKWYMYGRTARENPISYWPIWFGFDLPPPISIRPISLARRKFARWRLDIIIVTSRIPQPCDHHYQRNYHYQHIDRRLVSQFQSSRSFRIRNHFLFKLRVQVSSINLSAHHISVFLIFILFCFLFNRKYNCTNARLLFYD